LGDLHFSTGDETLWAVILGAVLAAIGGFVSTKFEAGLRRREREHGAALLFGEILSVLELLIDMSKAARGVGAPYGTYTMRLLGAVRREAETYERNRESLYDLGDVRTRAQIHTIMVKTILGLEGVFDATALIQADTVISRQPGLDEASRLELEARLASAHEDRDRAFHALAETAGQIAPIVAVLRPLAKQDFRVYSDVAAA
jgi:LPXTG-motif cell wall-anchored protein